MGGDIFGGQISAEGDFDGDGMNDLLVGAYQDFGQGKAYLFYFYGKTGLTNTSASAADLTITGENPGDAFGSAIGFVGDVNGDGYDDFAVTAAGYDVSGGSVANNGRLYIFFGGGSRLTGTISASFHLFGLLTC